MKMINIISTFFLFGYPIGESFAFGALSVGEVSVTIQQYAYLYANYVKEYKDRNGSPPPADSIAAWEDALKDRLFLLADATKKGYADDHLVNRIVGRAEITMLVQPQGLLYEEVVVKQVTVTEADVTEAYERKAYGYEIRYIDTTEEITQLAFDRAYNAGLSAGTAQTKTHPWPFRRHYTYRRYIISLQAGQVSQPLKTDNGFRIIRIDAVKPAIRKSLEEMAPSLRTSLEHYEELRIRDEYEETIHRTAHTVIATDAVALFAGRLGKNETAAVDTAAVCDILDLALATYVRNEVPVRITVADFLDYYNNLFMRKRLADVAVVIAYLREMVFEVFAYADAVARGLNTTEQFILDKWNYTNMVMLGEYEKREIDPRVIVPDSDCRAYYDAHRDRLVDGEIAVADILTFESRTDAERMRIRLMAPTGADSASVPEPDITHTAEYDIAIRYDNADYSEEIRAMLFALEDGRVSRAVELQGKPRVFVQKNETGRRQQPLEEVKKTIHRKLFTEKKAEYIRALIDSLKTVYKLSYR